MINGKELAEPETPVHIFVSKQGYMKKITPQSLRMSGEQKFKEGDSLSFTAETTSRAEILVFTDKFQCYKSRLSEFEDSKASLLGDYLPQKLGMEPGETVVSVVLPGDYSGFVLFFFENGKAAKVPLSAYETKTNRKKLTGAYSDKSPLRTVLCLKQDEQLVAYSTDNRALIFSTALLLPKTTRNTQGVSVLGITIPQFCTMSMYFGGQMYFLYELFEKERALKELQRPFDGRYGDFSGYDQPMFTSS